MFSPALHMLWNVMKYTPKMYPYFPTEVGSPATEGEVEGIASNQGWP